MLHLLALAMLQVGAGLADDGQTIEGVVVSGTRGEAPVAGATVILRAGQDGALVPVAETVTDANGHFVFAKVPVEPEIVYLPGANQGSVHYPGPRLRLQAGTPSPRVKLTVFDTIADPSPLVAERHEIDIHIQAGVLEITETLLVHNPSLTTYVGEGDAESGPGTLVLQIPAGFDRVTFHNEFHGRRFQIEGGRLVTRIPWTPGKRELKFTYHLPVTEGLRALNRRLDLPSMLVRVRVRGENADRVECNLPRVAGDDNYPAIFASSDQQLPAGHPLTLQLGGLPAPWIAKARWAAIVLLGGLILGTAWLLRSRKNRAAGELSESASDGSDIQRRNRRKGNRLSEARTLARGKR